MVEVKKTQRLEDYPIISNLALAWFDQPEGTKSSADFKWALDNIFTLTALRMFFEEHPRAAEVITNDADCKMFGDQVRRDEPVSDALEQKLTVSMQNRMAALQQADRTYWRDIITELKQFRANGELMREGAEVYAKA